MCVCVHVHACVCVCVCVCVCLQKVLRKGWRVVKVQLQETPKSLQYYRASYASVSECVCLSIWLAGFHSVCCVLLYVSVSVVYLMCVCVCVTVH